jgi:hypothetical protein
VQSRTCSIWPGLVQETTMAGPGSFLPHLSSIGPPFNTFNIPFLHPLSFIRFSIYVYLFIIRDISHFSYKAVVHFCCSFGYGGLARVDIGCMVVVAPAATIQQPRNFVMLSLIRQNIPVLTLFSSSRAPSLILVYCFLLFRLRSADGCAFCRECRSSRWRQDSVKLRAFSVF